MTSSRRRRGYGGVLGTLALLTAFALFASACGVQRDTGPQVLSPSELPAALTHTNPPTTVPQQSTTTTLPLDNAAPVTVWNVLNGQLNSYTFAVRRTSLTLPFLLRELNAGSGIDLAGDGVTSDVPIGANLRALGISKGIADVDLGDAFLVLSGTTVSLALGQIVFTIIYSLRNVAHVQFYANGAKQDVETGTGALTTGPVDECDYASLLPPNTPKTDQPHCAA